MKRPNVRLQLQFDVTKLWPDMPRKVNISVATIGISLLFYVIMLFTLGSANDDASRDVSRLKQELATAKTNLQQAKVDQEFILANKERIESLTQSDKLIPHTRRTAIRQMQSLALEFGLDTLNYNFAAAGVQSAQAVSAQPRGDMYRVYVENIELVVGAPLDKNIYSFIAAVHDDFPGSMVLSSVDLQRARTVTPEALNAVSLGQSSGLVTGKILYSWRTAQQNKEDKKAGGK